MRNADAIHAVKARQVLDSRGNPTLEVEVICASGAFGRAIVPSGASTGKHEARELRDGDARHFGGKGVLQAVANVQQILSPAVIGMPVAQQEEIDAKLLAVDGTPDKSRLGANAILGLSLACAHAAAHGVPLWRHLDTTGSARMPAPMVNLISGGLHAGGNLEMQDFLLMPVGAASFADALEMSVGVYRALAAVLGEHGHESTLVGDEGGFGPRLKSNDEALELIMSAIDRAGYKPGKDAAIAIDVASTHFYQDGYYSLGEKQLDADAMIKLLSGWVVRYPISSIEDGLAEDDWDGWKRLTDTLGQRVQLIGDDLFVTNSRRLRRGIESGIANSILIKLNQIGTLTETLAVIRQAKAAGYRPVISARSGETEDTTIADLAVATGVGQIKIGSVVRSERLAKYNQLLRIEEEMRQGR